jgi:hypothetical protein
MTGPQYCADRECSRPRDHAGPHDRPSWMRDVLAECGALLVRDGWPSGYGCTYPAGHPGPHERNGYRWAAPMR